MTHSRLGGVFYGLWRLLARCRLKKVLSKKCLVRWSLASVQHFAGVGECLVR